VVVTLASSALAQTNHITTNSTIVSIHATDAAASEAGHTGRFLVSRGERTNGDLFVWLQIGGSASNGVDYQALSNIVLIPSGARGTEIVVTPIEDLLPEPTESVVVRLVPSPLASPLPSYAIASPGSATVTIADNDPVVETNRPPVAGMVQPLSGATFHAGADIELRAEAYDSDGFVASVEFFANDHSLGLGHRGGAAANTSSNLWLLTWSNAPAGEATLVAKATDNRGAMGSSHGVRILIVSNTPPPPPTNHEPVTVSIVATDPYASEGLVMWCSNLVVGVNAQGANDAWRTNCPNVLGTNTATFTVRRTGPTNDSLRVYYAIGGTASNGVDYSALSGVVTIPAGRRSAGIVVMPIDDAVREHLETVLIKLRFPPTPLDPADSAYALGRPESAAAFIVDNDTVAPPPRVFPDGMFHVCEHLTNGCFRVEISTNFANWDIICTNSVVDGMARHVDPDAANDRHRFYRIVPIPCPRDEP
jgi:hypothetical protein